MSAPCPTLGFVLQITFDASVASGRDHRVDQFTSELFELLEANGLIRSDDSYRGLEYAEGPEGVILIFPITREGAQATDADRLLVLDWAKRRAHVGRVAVSDLVDLTQLPP